MKITYYSATFGAWHARKVVEWAEANRSDLNFSQMRFNAGEGPKDADRRDEEHYLNRRSGSKRGPVLTEFTENELVRIEEAQSMKPYGGVILEGLGYLKRIAEALEALKTISESKSVKPVKKTPEHSVTPGELGVKRWDGSMP